MPTITSRRWCFTSYRVELRPKIEGESPARYLIYQGEVCPETKRQHLQGYAEFSKPVSRKVLQGLVGDNTCHCEVARGTREQARDYCKDRSKQTFTEVFESGNWESGGQGTRNDLEGATNYIKANRPLRDVAQDMPTVYVKYHKGLKELDFILNEPPTWRTVSTSVFHGTPGSGKSKLARQLADDAKLSYYALNTDRKELWYDGYQGQPVLIIDDIDDSSISHKTLKKITDGHKYMVPVKGGFVWAKWTIVYITSEVHPSNWWGSTVDAKDGIWRRLTNIKKI